LAIHTTIFRRDINKNSSRGPYECPPSCFNLHSLFGFDLYRDSTVFSIELFLNYIHLFYRAICMSNFSQENLLAMKLSPIPYQPALLWNNFALAVPRPPHKRPNHRRGWQNALKICNPSSMSLPSILTSNERSLFNKSDYLDLMLTDGIYRSTGVICCQDTWLNRNIDSSLITLSGSLCFRSDRPSSDVSRGGGVATFVNYSWCHSPKVVSSYTADNIN